jgi:hypothetical protein
LCSISIRFPSLEVLPDSCVTYAVALARLEGPSKTYTSRLKLWLLCMHPVHQLRAGLTRAGLTQRLVTTAVSWQAAGEFSLKLRFFSGKMLYAVFLL